MTVPPTLRAAVQLVVPSVVLAAGLYAGFRPAGPLPPLGPLLDPLHGVWAVATQPELPEGAIAIPTLSDSVRVVFDDRAVPHIFARNVLDGIRTLGYLHAWFRAFQLELQTRATRGTLTEWLGPRLLAFDRSQRALGLARSAERDAATLDPNGELSHLLLAYTEGVNARLAELSSRDLPVEYRLLNRRPEAWAPVNTLYLMKRMGYTLAYLPDERLRARVAELVGPDAAAALMPVVAPIQEPIVPSPGGPRRPRSALPAPRLARGPLPPLPPLAGDGGGREASNNWVVAPWRTADGYALLAGDPHLDLSLPSIWFEVHLVVRDTLDLYGVSFPGAPIVPIGFNRDVAWSFTNTGADVLDFYRERLDHDSMPSRYQVDGAWRPLEARIEVYRDARDGVLATDTLYFTHRGPLLRDDAGRPLSMRWTVLEGDGGGVALWDASRARSVLEWLSAMERFRAPIQNGVVADRAGDIAVLSAGRYPVRPGGADGMAIRDGSSSANDWQGDLPTSRYPYARNPAQGFLASANQQPIDPAVDPVYLGANWPAPWRALRINQLLRADSAVTVDDMRAFQTDPGSARADRFVPALLDAVAREAAAGRATADMQAAADALRGWDRRYTKDNDRAVLFEAAMTELAGGVWDELIPAGGERRAFTPSDMLLAALLDDPTNVWWDDRRTADTVETRDAILAQSLAVGWRRARDRYGDLAAGGWRWDRVRHENIYHLLRFPSFSALDVPVQGGPGLLNPSSGGGTHGASWRMVVQLGPEVRAWGVFPGGESGNPMSRWYRDRIPKWAAGELDPLPLPHAPDELPAERRAGAVTFSGPGR